MLKIFHKKLSKGFTLIELLIVIAIIGLLATIVLVSLNSARSKARNTKRVSDLRQVQLGAEIYYDKNGDYPATVAAAVADGSMAAEPKDPDTDAIYVFCRTADFQAYTVGAQLEDPADARTVKLMQSSALAANVPCTPGGWSNCGASGTGRYCVSP